MRTHSHAEDASLILGHAGGNAAYISTLVVAMWKDDMSAVFLLLVLDDIVGDL